VSLGKQNLEQQEMFLLLIPTFVVV